MTASVTPHAPSPQAPRSAESSASSRPPRRRAVRVLVALTSSTALLATAALVAAAAIVPPIGARRAARLAARAEAVALLAPDEMIRTQLFTSQRQWTDMWRESFGVLIVTDRRVLHVVAPPTPLLRPREDGPIELRVTSLSFDEAFTISPRADQPARVRALVLRTPFARTEFFVDPASWRDARDVIDGSTRARRSASRAESRLLRAAQPPVAPPEQYGEHVVRRGQTLTGLARTYRTSPDILRQLNQLPSDTIKVGQRLRVPLQPEDDREDERRDDAGV